MNTAAIIAIAVASAVGGAALTGWAVKSRDNPSLAHDVLGPSGYVDPADVPVGAPPGNLPWQGLNTPNPLGNSPGVINAGKRLFGAMNCAGCHGYGAVGGMGPALNDRYWRYGGAPVQIYSSIFNGRPQGMPAWGVALPPREIWALTAYISSLGPSSGSGEGDNRGTHSGTANGPKPSKSGAGLEGQ